MARDRKGAQLSFELPPELLERLRAHAEAQRRTVASLLRGWIEAGLAGALEPSTEPSTALVGLANRVEALEREVAQLQAGALRVPRRDRVEPLRVPLGRGQLEIIGAKHLQAEPASPDRVIPAPPAGDLPPGGIETAELAERLGMRRGTLNARIARAGGAREGLVVEGWRCVGLRVPDRGGPARALWMPA